MANIFDIEGARQAGYSNAEILAHMAQQASMRGQSRPAQLNVVRSSEAPETAFQDLKLPIPAVERARAALQPVLSKISPDFGPVTGGPIESPNPLQLPTSKTDLALMAATALLPGAIKAAPAALRAGTTILEGAAPDLAAEIRDARQAGASSEKILGDLAAKARARLGELGGNLLSDESGELKIPGKSQVPGEPEPDVGPHGPIFRDFRHDAEGAIAKLQAAQGGEATAALHHPEVGDIDLAWGKAGDPAKEYSDGFGLAHIAAKHPELVPKLQEIISKLKVTKRTANRIQLEDSSHIAKVRLDWDGEAKKWLLTAFEKD